MSTEPTVSLRAVVATLPDRCYENPTWKGLVYLTRDVVLYAVVLAALAYTDSVVALLILWPLAGLCISALFVLGHDAAHGSLFRSEKLCQAVGTMALLPSLHAYAPWKLGHNRIHHVHTARAGYDFVWNPLTPAEYEALPLLRKARHRVEWSAWGAGIYYLRVIWWERMMRLDPPARFQADFRRDRRRVWAYAAVFSGAALVFGGLHTGSVAGSAWMWLKVVLLPWLCWNQTMGATVHLHHVGADLRWHTEATWSRVKGQMGATMNYVVPRWYNVFAHNIYVHMPHHVDMRIPFYALPLAAESLAQHFGDLVRTRPLRLRDYLATTRQCKLFDYDRGIWCGYDGTPARVSSARSR